MKAFYYVVTTGFKWARGVKLATVLATAGLDKIRTVKNKGNRPVNFIIYIGLVDKSATDEQVKQIMECFCVADMGSIMKCSDLSNEDETLIDKSFEGWITDESFCLYTKVLRNR